MLVAKKFKTKIILIYYKYDVTAVQVTLGHEIYFLSYVCKDSLWPKVPYISSSLLFYYMYSCNSSCVGGEKTYTNLL